MTQYNTNTQAVDAVCKLCEAYDYEVIYSHKIDKTQYNKILCRGCGLIAPNPLPSLTQLAVFYKKRYTRSLNSSNIPKLSRLYKAIHRAVPRYNRIRPWLHPNIKVLDVSANCGEFLYLLRQKGIEGVGIEHNPFFIEYAKSEYGLPLQHALLDEFNSMPGDEQFDIIVANHSLHLHLDPCQTLHNYYARLKDRGIINIEVPNIESISTPPYQRFRFKHFYNFNLHTLQSMVKKAGFTVLNTILIPGSLHINVILQKSVPQACEVRSGQNYANVKNALHAHTLLGYFLSSMPYQHALNHAISRIKIMAIVQKYKSGKEMAEDIFSKV